MKNLVISCLESRVERNKSLYARFVLAPFEKGSALTIGTALRRVLLSKIEGIAITALDIQGITHEFCTIPGVRESVLELSLNFQQIVLQSQTPFQNSKIGYLQVQGPATVCANDLKLPLGVECVDPTQHIATLSRDGLLVVKFLVSGGAKNAKLQSNNKLLTSTNIQRAKELLCKNSDFQETQKRIPPNTCFQNIIPLHSFCVPINRANFTIQVDDLSHQERERLLFEIWTNGSIHPRQALQYAVLSLIDLFSKLRTLIHIDSHSLGIRSGIYVPSPDQGIAYPPIHDSQMKESSLSLTKKNISKRLSYLYSKESDNSSLLSSDLSNLSLSLKTYTLLKRKGVHKLETLLKYSAKDILEIVCGNASMFSEIQRCVSALGFESFT